MEKPRILSIGSESYSGGRIDSFKIEIKKDLHHSIIPLFLELGFPKEDVMDKLDVIYGEMDYIFIYGNPKIKAHFIIEKDNLSIKLDTNEDREKIIEIFEKYFEFPEK